MAIADVGNHPRKLSAELLRQIRAQLRELPLPVPLRDIAFGLGISEIVEHDSANFLGALVMVGNRSSGIISLQRDLAEGQRNFTLGHEVGHFVSLHHKPPPEGFKCAAPGIRLERARHLWDRLDRYQKMEIEANEFSASILVPVTEYRRERAMLQGIDLEHLDTLRLRFGVSKEMMARIYVDTSPDDIAIVVSQHGRYRRHIARKSFPYLGMRSQIALPHASLTVQCVGTHRAGFLSSVTELATDIWLENGRGWDALTEQVLIQRDGWALTLLNVEPSSNDRDEAPVDEEWQAPRFAYGR